MKPLGHDSDLEVLFCCSQMHPAEGQVVRLYLSSGEMKFGFWDGESWLSNGRSVEPEYWQDLTAETRARLIEMQQSAGAFSA